MVKSTSDLDAKIVVFGMSCVGKTTFAIQCGRPYYCFDELFHWHVIETFGLSASANMLDIKSKCAGSNFIIDGWHLCDAHGAYLPDGAVVYVVYASYDNILSQYRVPVRHWDEHKPMFRKWYYEIDYAALPGVRYFRNAGDFLEETRADYLTFLERNQRIVSPFGILGKQ